jgi:hypothetical protein
MMRFLLLGLLGITIGMFSTLVVTLIPSQAEEVRLSVPSYEGEELEKIRQWENTWVGKRIDPTTVDKVKEFVPQSLYQLMQGTETWGESWFEIVPYREIKPSKGELKFTSKHAGTCSIGPNQELLNHICGIPFPKPKTGLEIAYNFDNLNQGDNAHSFQNIYMIDGKNRYDRKMGFESHLLYFSGRREIPPAPEIIPNERRFFRVAHGAYYEPASMKGSRSLMIKFIDRTKPFESWSFSSTTRKLQRLSTAQRAATQGGSDSTNDDQGIYNGAISYMKYKYLGRKELLLARHQDIDQLKKGHREGYCLFSGIQRERINTHVLECIHKDPAYLYSKQIWHVDPETWWILYADKYDRQGRLWRVFENTNYVLKSVYNEALIGTIGFVSIVDVKQLHATGGFGNYIIGQTGELYQPEYYTPKAIQKHGY